MHSTARHSMQLHGMHGMGACHSAPNLSLMCRQVRPLAGFFNYEQLCGKNAVWICGLPSTQPPESHKTGLPQNCTRLKAQTQVLPAYASTLNCGWLSCCGAPAFAGSCAADHANLETCRQQQQQAASQVSQQQHCQYRLVLQFASAGCNCHRTGVGQCPDNQ